MTTKNGQLQGQEGKENAMTDEIRRPDESSSAEGSEMLAHEGVALSAQDEPVKNESATPEGDRTAGLEPFALESKPAPPAREPKRNAAKEKEKEEASQSPFSVTVGQVYDGPLDLLLDLIRKQNIDVYDIPIARITSQFLEYTHHLKQVDVDAAGEFIYMASLLIHIKSKTLLPRDPSDVLGGDAEDPRRELVERLLEHERFKAAAQMLLQKQQIEEATWTNSGLKNFRKDIGEAGAPTLDEDREIDADTVDLVRVFQDVLDRLRERPILNVDEESVTVAQMIDYVKRRLMMEEKPVSLRRLLHSTHTERALICMFLAMLELVRLQAVLLHQPGVLGDILIKKTENFDQVLTEHAQARDDWR
jgi:segregation and condensation protein A